LSQTQSAVLSIVELNRSTVIAVSNNAGQPDQAPPHGVAFAHYFPRDANAESLAMAVEALHNQKAHQIDGSLVFLKNLDDSCYIKSDTGGKMSIASAPDTRGSRIATGQVAERLKHGVVNFAPSAHYSSDHVQAIPTGYEADKLDITYTQCSVVGTRTGVVVDVDKFFVTFDDVYLRPNRSRMDVEMNNVPAILSDEESGQPTWST